jgi:hypothetical protein
MTTVQAFKGGVRRVNDAPAVLVGVFVATFAAALPLSLMMRQLMSDSLAGRLAAVTAARGVDAGWWQQFSGTATGLASSFSPTIVGGAAALNNLASVVDNQPRAIALVAAGLAYMLVWLFLAGGILDRFARKRAVGAAQFFSAAGVFFFRFIRLAVISGAIYGFVFAVLHPLLFGAVYARAVRDFTVERHAFVVYCLAAVIFGLVLSVVNLVFDYAKVRAVVEDRRSMVLSIGAAIRFVRNHPRALLLYLLNGGVFVLVVAGYVLLAPGGNAPTWLVVAAGQLYVLARLWVKLLFYASATELLEGSFAHAAYVRPPVTSWPDSPAAEAIAPRG